MTKLRGELRCMACSRYLGDFESGPVDFGAATITVIEPDYELQARALANGRGGFSCSRCGGRARTEYVERVAA